jgi:chromosome segregation ATPase
MRVKGEPEILQETLSQAQTYIQTRSQEVLGENRVACRRYATDLLEQLFAELSSQLHQNLLPNGLYDLAQLDPALQEVFQIYDSNALEFGGVEKCLLHFEAKAAFLQDLLHQLSHQLSGEMTLQRSLDSQSRERLESQLRETREELRVERQRQEDRVKGLLVERAELEAQWQLAREQLDSFRQARDEETRDLRDEVHRLRESCNEQVDAQREAREELEERVQQLQREKLQVQSEREKERALFDQKVEFLERSLAEKSERERGYLTELHTKRSELTGELKATCQKYEGEIK